MPDDELKKKVADALKPDGGAAPYDQVVSKLRELAAAIEATLGAVEVRVLPGHRVNLGQQYNFFCRIPKIGFRDILFRAYVPPAGFPVTLELFEDERPECRSLEELEGRVIGFLANPNMKQRLLALKQAAE